MRTEIDTDKPESGAPGRFTAATEWVGRITAVVALALLVLVIMAIHKGQVVQQSSRTIVENFTNTNGMFDERADLTAPSTARKQLEELTGILADLNAAAAVDVEHLGSLLPNASVLVDAGRDDAEIAGQLEGVALVLQDSAASLNQISTDADITVSQVDGALDRALTLVAELNAELARTTDKLAPIPATGPFIPAPEGIR